MNNHPAFGTPPFEGGELPDETKVSKSFLLFYDAFFRAFRQIIGLGQDDGGIAPFVTVGGKERASIWRTLNGWKWTITIEREKI